MRRAAAQSTGPRQVRAVRVRLHALRPCIAILHSSGRWRGLFRQFSESTASLIGNNMTQVSPVSHQGAPLDATYHFYEDGMTTDQTLRTV